MKCPICKKESIEHYCPFCSKRCADVDLYHWLSGSYTLPVDEEQFHEADNDIEDS